MLISALLLLLPCLISANMWDNLYNGQGVPYQLPFDFDALLSPTGFSNILKYHIFTSTYNNGLSVNTTSPIAANSTVISQMKFNFTTGTMIAYSDQRGCVRIRNSSMVYADFYSTVEGMLEIALLMNSYDIVNMYRRVDVTQLLKVMNLTGCVSNLALYFLRDDYLRIIENHFTSGNKSSFTIDRITQTSVDLSEFTANADWQCQKMKIIQINGTNYVVNDYSNDDDDGDDDSDDDNNNENLSENYDKNVTSQPESLIDLVLDYVIPINMDKNDRDQVHDFMEEFFVNYIGCRK